MQMKIMYLNFIQLYLKDFCVMEVFHVRFLLINKMKKIKINVNLLFNLKNQFLIKKVNFLLNIYTKKFI